MSRLFLILIILMAFSSCEEEYDSDIKFAAGDYIVVEGIFTTELKRHTVKLTKAIATQNEIPDPITGAIVAFVDQDENIYQLPEFPRGSGIYRSRILRANFGRFYALYIAYDGKEYVGIDSPPAGEFIRDIELDTVSVDGADWYSLITQNRNLGNNPSYIEYTIDWSGTDACSSGCEGRQVIYDLKNIDVQETFSEDKEKLIFPPGSRVIRRRHSISERYQEYLRGVLSETEWRGGYFDVERENPTGNMSNDALGFFAVTSVTVDTIYVD